MTAGDLVRFHTRHKLLLMAHSPLAARRLGQLVARAGDSATIGIAAEYRALFDDTCALPATRGGHVNALQHMAGYFRDRIDASDRRHLAGLIERYRVAEAPLAAPVAAIAEHARRLGVVYLVDQVYLQGY